MNAHVELRPGPFLQIIKQAFQNFDKNRMQMEAWGDSGSAHIHPFIPTIDMGNNLIVLLSYVYLPHFLYSLRSESE